MRLRTTKSIFMEAGKVKVYGSAVTIHPHGSGVDTVYYDGLTSYLCTTEEKLLILIAPVSVEFSDES